MIASSYVVLTWDDNFLILGQDQSRSRCLRPHKVRAQVTDYHNLSLFFLRPPPSLYLCPSPGILIWLYRLCYTTHSASSSSLAPRSRFNWVPCFVTLGPLRRSTPSAASARMKWGLNGLSRLCHITCFFTSTIRLWPRLSRALLLSFVSMPDKLSGYRSFRFFSCNMASFRFSDFSSLIPIF